MIPAVRQSPVFWNALVRVRWSPEVTVAYRCWLSTHSPDRNVEWPSQLLPPKVEEVSQPLLAAKPASARPSVAVSRVRRTPGEISGSSTALRP
ncbi:hypothetical protein GCM10020295_56020 [Streptomyces cinereospinus]